MEKTRTSGAFEMLQPVRRSPDCSKKKCFKKLLIYVFCLLGEKKRNVLMEGHKSHFSYFDNELHCFYQYFKIVLLFFACQLKELEDGQVETVH